MKKESFGQVMTPPITLIGAMQKELHFLIKPSVKKIFLRLPESMLEELKLLANKRDVPYQSLLKIFLAERIEEELGAH